MCLENGSILFNYEEDKPILGIRGWRYGLASLSSTGFRWVAHYKNTARCNQGRAHTPAEPECSCGFYAYNSYESYKSQQRQHGSIVGVIAGWGQVAIHPNGWRSQYAKVLAVSSAMAHIRQVPVDQLEDFMEEKYREIYYEVLQAA